MASKKFILRKKTKIFGSGVMLMIFLVTACSSLTEAVLGPEELSEMERQQTEAVLTLDALGTAAEDPSRPQEDTSTPVPSPTQTGTPTPPLDAEDGSGAQPRIYMSENTFCRSGPGIPYDREAVVYRGEEAPAFAQNPDRDFWYIENPDHPGNRCWAWGQFVTPVGDTQELPIYTPPPTPTPAINFTVSYQSLEGPCFGGYAVMYRINNVGGEILRSWKSEAIDYTGGSLPQTWYNNDFVRYDGCKVVDRQINLTAGNGESYFFVSRFAGNPEGHEIGTRITVCTEDWLNGHCSTQTIRHVP